MIGHLVSDLWGSCALLSREACLGLGLLGGVLRLGGPLQARCRHRQRDAGLPGAVLVQSYRPLLQEHLPAQTQHHPASAQVEDSMETAGLKMALALVIEHWSTHSESLNKASFKKYIYCLHIFLFDNHSYVLCS